MKKLLTASLLVLAPGLLFPGCGPEEIGRETYVRWWAVATLRAREKGTEPAEEVEKILEEEGVPVERMEAAHLRWFDEETNRAIRREVRRVLETPRLPSRGEYVGARVRAYLRSRIRGTPFREELRAVAGRFDCTPASFREAERIWAGDAETREEIRREYERLQGALNVSWSDWKSLRSGRRGPGSPPEARLADALEKRGIDPGDWKAMEDLFGGV